MKHRGRYPKDWKEIATAAKQDAGWVCERCRHAHDRSTGHVLTVHHLDGNKANCESWNLAVLCQRCHLTIQAHVNLEQGVFEFRISPWFKPHLKGYLTSLKNAKEVLA